MSLHFQRLHQANIGPRLNLRALLLLSLTLGLASHKTLAQQDSAPTSELTPTTGTNTPYSLTPVYLMDGERMTLDGRLSELFWQRAQVVTGMTQMMPTAGSPSHQRTEMRVALDNEHLYVAMEAFDSAMDSITSPLFRRDGEFVTDWLFFGIDSYYDRRTAFFFALNPAGVHRDQKLYDDSKDDILWDAVWDGETSIQDSSWVAEFRIPLSQLRFKAEGGSPVWGINFGRDIARYGETSFWAPLLPDQTGIASRFGTLSPIQGLNPGGRLEILPYASQGVTRAPSSTPDPFYRRNDPSSGVGVDMKYTFQNGLTASVTLNPDFGQVEADPTQINLSDSQLFFPEKRPFFVEGNDIFQFGRTKSYASSGPPIPFYSRRVGRTPIGSLGAAGVEGSFLNRPEQTTILSASKLSGKTSNGWSIGLLHAATAPESAPFLRPDGSEGLLRVEPFAQIGVSRIRKDFAGGSGTFGAFAGGIRRDIDGTYFETFLPSSALIVGLDGEKRMWKNQWIVSAAGSVSNVRGSEQAMVLLQRSPVRYYQRPDSDRLRVDSTLTSLSGITAEASLQKQGGEHWQGSITYSMGTPGYEANDLGFQNQAGYHISDLVIAYNERRPVWAQNYELFLYVSRGFNTDLDMFRRVNGGGFSANLRNQWGFGSELFFAGGHSNPRLTRGGPLAYTPKGIRGNTFVRSNRSKDVYATLRIDYYRDASGEGDYSIGLRVNAQPLTSMQVSIEPGYNTQFDTDQYVRAVSDPMATATYGVRYVFADTRQQAFEMPIRLNWTFTPDLTLETFLRSFVVRAEFNGYKEFRRPGSFEFDVYGTDKGSVLKENGFITIEPDGVEGAELIRFSEPDLNLASLQGNVVLRWEYRPGSTIFVVWQHQKQDFISDPMVEFGTRFGDLLETAPTNIFLVKATWWFNN